MAFKLSLSQDAIRNLVENMQMVYIGMIAWMVVVVVAGSIFGTCEDGPPNVLFYAFSMYLFAMCAWQFYFLAGSAENAFDWAKLALWIGLGLQEVADFQSDGTQLLSARLCDDSFHERFITSLDDSNIAFLKPFAASLHVYGLMAMFLGGSTILVVCCGFFLRGEDPEDQLCFWAVIVGMGAISEAAITHPDIKMPGFMARFLSVVFCEVVPQSVLGASLFGLSFTVTNDSAKLKQLLALGLTAMSLIKAGVDGLYLTAPVLCRSCHPFSVATASVSLASIVAVIVMGFRVYYAYACPSHLLNIGRGCASITVANITVANITVGMNRSFT